MLDLGGVLIRGVLITNVILAFLLMLRSLNGLLVVLDGLVAISFHDNSVLLALVGDKVQVDTLISVKDFYI